MKITTAEVKKFLEILEQNPRRISDAAMYFGEEHLHLRPDKKS